MRIKEIRIEGLFGLFDHSIPLNMEEGLTIVYGENGIGKTMIFRMLDWLRSGNTTKLKEIPFSRFIVLLEDDSELFFLPEYSDTQYFDTLTNLFNKFTRQIHLIDTQRLIFFRSETDIVFKNGELQEKESLVLVNRVDNQAKHLAKIIASIEEKYYQESEQLGLSLANRLVENQVRMNYDLDDLKNGISSIEQSFERLHSVGLLSKHEYETFKINGQLDDLSKALISVNIQDFQIKLKVFDDLYEKLRLFLDIINNRRFSYKKIYITKEGFHFKNIKGKLIEPSQLSSGEQHELILIYRLLFEIPEGSLVLIDEPEISLHIVWQQEFIKDMQDIIKLRKIDILAATHSPAIINGNWDLTVSLKGIEEEAYA